jgi:hypothetical protein
VTDPLGQLRRDLLNGLMASVVVASAGSNGGKPEGFLTSVQFTLVKADLPQNVQDAANSALAQFAKVSELQAQVQQAQLQAAENAAKQAGYAACQTIDELNALPKGLLSLGSGSGLVLGAK